ncbi:MAG: methionine ABC transporter permease [Longicatena sp.]
MLEFLNQIMPNIMNKLPEFGKAIIDTFLMLGITGFISLIFGILFGVILIVTRPHDILENKIVYFVLGKIIDLLRAVPFIILIFWLSPLSQAIMGTNIQLKGAIIPLIVGTVPFFARQIESALAQLDRGLIEASQAMGCSPMEIIVQVYLRESIPSIIRATSITLIALIGYIAMVGAIGGGGIGDFAIRYGYNGYQHDATFVCVIVLLLITSCIQGLSNILIKKTTH